MEKFIHFNIERKTNTEYSMMIDESFVMAMRQKTGRKFLTAESIIDAFSNPDSTDESLREACIEVISVLGWQNTEILREKFGTYAITSSAN